MFRFQMMGQGAMALGGMAAGSAIGQARQNVPTLEFVANQFSRRMGSGYGGRSEVKGWEQYLSNGLTGYNDTTDLAGGASTVMSTIGRNDPAQMKRALTNTSGLALLTGGGFQNAASIQAEFASAEVNNNLQQKYGAGLVGPGGQIRSMDEFLQGLTQLGLADGSGKPITAQQARSKGFEGFQQGQRGYNNLAKEGLSAEAIAAVQEYAVSGSGNEFFNVSKAASEASEKDTGVGDHIVRDQQKLMESQTQLQVKIFSDIYTQMEAELELRTKMNETMKGLDAKVFQFGDLLAQITGAAGGVLNAFIALKLLGGGSGLPGAGLVKAAAGQAGATTLLGGGGLAGTAAMAIPVAAAAGAGIYAAKQWENEYRADPANADAGFWDEQFAGFKAAFGFGNDRGSRGSAAGRSKRGDKGDPPSNHKGFGFIHKGDPPLPGDSTGLNPGLEEKLRKMFQENPRLTINSGFRTYEEQVAVYNKFISGKGPQAAKPGSSRHESGNAADIGPASEYGWLAANAARFGLAKTVASEPWHFEDAGGRTQGNVAATQAADREQKPNATVAPTLSTGAAVNSFLGMNKTAGQILKEVFSAGPAGPNYRGVSGAGGVVGGGSAAAAPVGSGGNASISGGKGSLSAAQIRAVAAQAGFTGQALDTAVAIALAESSGNPGGHNNKGEDSRGLWQINVDAHGEKFGNLYDPLTNARAAFAVSGGGKNFNPWTTYSGATAHGRARNYTQFLGVGDPPSAGSGGGGGGSVNASRSVSIGNITMHVHVASASPDEAKRLANMVMGEIANRAQEQMVGAV